MTREGWGGLTIAARAVAVWSVISGLGLIFVAVTLPHDVLTQLPPVLGFFLGGAASNAIIYGLKVGSGWR